MRVDKKVKNTYDDCVVHLPRWRTTALSTPIELYASHPLQSAELNNCVLLMGGVHGDEPLGVELAQATLEWLRHEKSVCPWIVIPCLNPDGLAANSRVNGRGVDLNRNYPASNWTKQDLKDRYYPGEAAGSEPEVKAVVHLIKTYEPKLLVHCHSWKPCVVCTGAPGKKWAKALADASGYDLTDSIGYDTPGSLSQYGWADREIPVICIEESDDASPGTTWNRFAAGMKTLFAKELNEND